jgi:chorismate mutase
MVQVCLPARLGKDSQQNLPGRGQRAHGFFFVLCTGRKRGHPVGEEGSIKKLERWRQEIDKLDLQLVDLLNQRARYALEIGKLKERENLRIYDPKREEQVVRNVIEASDSGPMKGEAMKRIFERIIDETRRAEREHRKSVRQAETLASKKKGSEPWSS